MKRILIPVLVASLSGCGAITVTIEPIPKKKHVRSTRHHAVQSKPKPKPTQHILSKNIKETWWVENYHKLEAAHGDYKIPADAEIEPLSDGTFKVPDEVLTHYQDLLLVTPSPKP